MSAENSSDDTRNPSGKERQPWLEESVLGETLRVYEVSVGSARRMLDLFDPISGVFVGGSIFRGQGDANWGLVPAAFRPNPQNLHNHVDSNLGPRTYGQQVRFEIELTWRFVARSNEAGLLLPGDYDEIRQSIDNIRNTLGWELTRINLLAWPPRRLVPVLTLAQHYGMPTRLLDWTYDPYAALYFAAESVVRSGKFDGYLAVWIAHLKDPDRRGIYGAPSVEIARPANAFNPNLLAQRGCVMVWRKGPLHETPFESPTLERLLSDEAHRAGVQGGPIFKKVLLPKSQAGHLMRLLNIRLVDASKLFPGFEGVAKSIREWALVGAAVQETPESTEPSVPPDELKTWFYKDIKAYDNAHYKSDPSDQFSQIRSSVLATLLCLRSGDYRSASTEKIAMYEEIVRIPELDEKLRSDISELIGELRKLAAGEGA